MKKIYKYATGESPPEGAVYLGTITQTKYIDEQEVLDCFYVWHYFLVEVKDAKGRKRE